MLVQAYPVQPQWMTIEEFLALEETDDNKKDELEFGWIVREPCPNATWHELDVASITHRLAVHVNERDLGFVLGSCGAALDRDRALLVRPDISVVLEDRFARIGDIIDGAPNLVVEVASPSTSRRDRGRKLSWYRAYGVQECWLADARRGVIEVYRMRLAPDKAGRVFRGDEVVESEVLPEFRFTVSQLLANKERERLAQIRDAQTRYDKTRS